MFRLCLIKKFHARFQNCCYRLVMDFSCCKNSKRCTRHLASKKTHSCTAEDCDIIKNPFQRSDLPITLQEQRKKKSCEHHNSFKNKAKNNIEQQKHSGIFKIKNPVLQGRMNVCEL